MTQTPPQETYRYYVIWLNFEAQQFGAGHDLFVRDQAVETYEDILSIRAQVQKKHNLAGVQILNWKRIS